MCGTLHWFGTRTLASWSGAFIGARLRTYILGQEPVETQPEALNQKAIHSLCVEATMLTPWLEFYDRSVELEYKNYASEILWRQDITRGVIMGSSYAFSCWVTYNLARCPFVGYATWVVLILELAAFVCLPKNVYVRHRTLIMALGRFCKRGWLVFTCHLPAHTFRN
jgi:hypothetical protein